MPRASALASPGLAHRPEAWLAGEGLIRLCSDLSPSHLVGTSGVVAVPPQAPSLASDRHPFGGRQQAEGRDRIGRAGVDRSCLPGRRRSIIPPSTQNLSSDNQQSDRSACHFALHSQCDFVRNSQRVLVCADVLSVIGTRPNTTRRVVSHWHAVHRVCTRRTTPRPACTGPRTPRKCAGCAASTWAEAWAPECSPRASACLEAA